VSGVAAGLSRPGGGAVKISIMTDAEGDPSGFDSAIIKVPPRWHVTVSGKPVLLAQLAGRELRLGSEG
jgi:hypothetical protein